VKLKGRKRIYIVYTGGTIGMRASRDGYVVEPGYLEIQMEQMPELGHPEVPAYTIHEYQPLLDSSNIMPDDWFEIAQDIAANHEGYDGFVVLHGTDTMAYTSSALAFMLEGLRKPVILTGAQIPLCELRSDGRENLITSMMMAANYPIPEVCLYFGNRLFRGCRSVKVHADSFDAFLSPNYPPLGEVGVDIEINWSLVRPQPAADSKLRIQRMQPPSVGALRLFPGISAEVLGNILKPPLQGLVLEAFGVGNGPDRDRDFIEALKAATDRGVVVVDCTQCLYGAVDLDDYATGAALARAGVISGYDMTTEAALAKLFYLFSAGYAPEEVKAKMGEDLRGEVSVSGGGD
jgi:L-asparaginase